MPDSEPSWKEWAAVFLLLLGGIVLPLLGWVIGVVLLWSSQVWNTRDKLIGTLLVPFGLGLPLFAITFAASGCGRAYRNGQLVLDTCAHRSAIQTVLPDVVMALLVLIPIGTAIYLGRRLIHR